jgi:hypothetical protein
VEPLAISATQEGKSNIFHLSGSIDERADFSQVTNCQADSLVLDFAGVSAINSMGIKKWAMVIERLAQKTISYENCTTLVMEQIIMFDALTSNIEIKTFFAPYHCETCDKEYDQKLTMEETKDKDFLAKLHGRFKCPSCDQVLTFYEDEEVYFSFLEG